MPSLGTSVERSFYDRVHASVAKRRPRARRGCHGCRPLCRRPGSRLTSPRARQRRHASPACTTRLPWSSAFGPSARTVVGLCVVGRVATFTFLAGCSALQRREVFAMGFSAAPSAPSSRKVYLWVLYCRVYSATAFKHSLVGFPPRAPLLRVVELLPLPLRAGGFHRACWQTCYARFPSTIVYTGS